MAVTIFTSPRFEEHTTPPGHPERPERAKVMQAVADRWRVKGGDVRDPRPATRGELARVHTSEYLDLVESARGRPAQLDGDTYTSPESVEIAELAAGAAIEAARLAREGTPAFAFVRPPGHHAEPDKAMGFCLYNHIAVAAADLLASGTNKVAIVDIDVHHGNGTQWAFYDEPRVLFISSHQFPFYPGTGAAEDTGSGAGKGFTINIPLAAGAGDDEFDKAYLDIVQPALQTFNPEVLLISAGFDTWIHDPLAGMRVTAGGFARIFGRLRAAAKATCGSRVMLVTEGGYDPAGLAAGLQAGLDAFSTI
ncbi:MAG TPA: histone deacetylase [Vicinamibacterales bacterium]|nr:histone deacetylase [Vicinamibacterales bacterium]